MPTPSTIQNFILATAGHVDHGKSTIIRALTGTDPDRLPEEKRRGITIDLGFAHLMLASPPSVQPAVEFRVGVIDVPGHEDFVKNMVAGVGSVDAVMLVVAADDGWMPQTEEHLQILTYQGVRRGVVAVSKIDLAADEGAAIDGIRRHLRGTFLAESPVVAVSVPTGRGIDQLRAALAAMLVETPVPVDVGKPRLPIDRVFSLRGIGTVVTGTLSGGALVRGQRVCVRPGGAAARIRSIQSYNRAVDRAAPGMRVALNLPDLHAATLQTAAAADAVRRGDTVTLEHLLPPASVLDVMLTRSPRAEPVALCSGARLRVHHGSVAVEGHVRLVGHATLAVGESVLARLRVDAPLAAAIGDRLVLRDWTSRFTLAGGIVLDPSPADSHRRLPQQRQLLLERAAGIDDAAVVVRTLVQAAVAVRRDALGQNTRFAQSAIAAEVDQLCSAGQLIAAGPDLLVDPPHWAGLVKLTGEAVDAHHRQHPQQSGLPLSELLPLITTAVPAAARPLAGALVEPLLQALATMGFSRSASAVRRRTHTAQLPPRLQPAAEQLRRQLREHRFDPPSRNQLAPTDLAQQALRFLLASGEAVELSADVVLGAAAYEQAVQQIRAWLGGHRGGTVAELKQLLGSSRRIMVPLLERLDREKITRREGDVRVLREG